MSLLFILLACGGRADKSGGPVLDTTSATSTSETDTTATTPSGTTDATDTPCLPEPGPRLVRRLTHAEYGATVRMLLQTELAPEASFAPDLTVDGHSGDATLEVSSLLAEQYRAAAEDLGAAAELDTLLPCDSTDRACADQFIGSWGRRAYRRPLTETERSTLLSLYDAVAAEEGFDEGIRWVIIAVLQTPTFLYRSELGARTAGEVFTLSDWELATELAYGVTGGPPDDRLLDAAAGGALSTPAGLQTELERLLGDARAAERVHEGVSSMLHLERLPQVVRDAEVYSELTTDLRTAMAEETRRLTLDVVASGGSFGDLLTADHTFLTEDLAAFYALPTPSLDADGWGRAELPPERDGGLLAHGSVLTTHALPTSSSPIHRGVMIREQLLCQELPPPPPDLNISPPPVDPSLSTRERYAAHSEVAACAGCHVLIDPIGFGFEHFDGIGRYRSMDGVHPVDASGEVIGTAASNGLFTGVGGLSDLIGTDAGACWIERSSRRLTGMELPHCDIELFAAESNRAGGALTDVWHGWVALPHFRERIGGSDERDAPLGGGMWTPPDPDPDLSDTGDTGSPEPEIRVVETVQDDWGTGYCMNVTVTNGTDAPVVWAVELAISGALSSSWSSLWTELGSGVWRVEGEVWNAELAPGEVAELGYCADR
jgi:hypothetical protein